MHLPSVDRLPHWRPQGADPYAPGTWGGAAPQRPDAGVHAPDKPSAPREPYRDWTIQARSAGTPQQTPEPPPEPIYKQLLELIRSIWRASGSAVEVAQDMERATLPERIAQQQRDQTPTYTDPKIKRTDSI